MKTGPVLGFRGQAKVWGFQPAPLSSLYGLFSSRAGPISYANRKQLCKHLKLQEAGQGQRLPAVSASEVKDEVLALRT